MNLLIFTGRLFGEVIHPMFEDDELIFQTLPELDSVVREQKQFKWHSDGDPDHKHPLGEVNIILPLTKCFDTNSIWVESIPGMGDFKPLTMIMGTEVLYWLS